MMARLPVRFPLFVEQLRRDHAAELQVWLGSRRRPVELRAVGLWVPVEHAAGFWACDLEHAEQIARRRLGIAPRRVRLVRVCAAWPWDLPPKEVPVRAADSPLGGVLLLPDPDERRPARAGWGPEEHRWLPVRPLVRAPQP